MSQAVLHGNYDSTSYQAIYCMYYQEKQIHQAFPLIVNKQWHNMGLRQSMTLCVLNHNLNQPEGVRVIISICTPKAGGCSRGVIPGMGVE